MTSFHYFIISTNKLWTNDLTVDNFKLSSIHPPSHKQLSPLMFCLLITFSDYSYLPPTGTDAIIIVFVRIPITHIIPPLASYKTSKLRMPTTTINPLKRKVHNTTYVKLTHLGRAIHSTRHEWLHYGSATFFIRVVGGTNSSSSSIVSCCWLLLLPNYHNIPLQSPPSFWPTNMKFRGTRIAV